ncbi:hypothetical protein HK100_005988, partial [Physocladia obscura]
MQVTALLALAATALAGPTGKFFDNYIFVIMENNDLTATLKSPEYAALIGQSVEFLDYHGTIHPSQPNYWSTIAQDTFRDFIVPNLTVSSGQSNSASDVGTKINGNNGDDFFNIEGVRNIADSLEDAGISWAIYSENYPGNATYCHTGDFGTEPNVTDANNIGNPFRLYKRKHNPFMSFTSINTNTTRCGQHVFGFDAWEAAVAADTFPEYTYIVPNQLDDAHDFPGDANPTLDQVGLAYSGAWLKTFLASIANSTYLNTRRTLIHITFDEDDEAYFLAGQANCTDTASDCPGDTTDNLVYGVLFGSAVAGLEGSTIAGHYDHYSIVATLNENWGLPALTNANSSGAP